MIRRHPAAGHLLARRQLLSACAIVAVPALLEGCGAPPPPPPPATLDLTLVGGKDQNPGTTGRPASVAVRVLQLAGTAKYDRADVFALIEREQATLGTDVLGSEEFVLAPGETRHVMHELKKDCQFIGVAVLFRDIDHATWKLKTPAPSTGPLAITVKTAGLVATLDPTPPPAA